MNPSYEEWFNKIKIIDSNENFLVLYKPEGLSFYEDSPAPDLMKILRLMDQEKYIPPGERLFPIHRIDKITSGILLFARGRKATNILSNHFRHHRIQKIYLALSNEKPKKKQGVIIGDMVKDRRSKWKLLHSLNNPSITLFKSFPIITEEAKYFRLFLLKPITGKTHQIRVAMRSLSAPILGDPIYSRPSLARQEDRAYLHAYGIKFNFENKTYEYIIPPTSGKYFLDKDIVNFLKQIGNPFEINWNYKIPKISAKKS
jgi:tRNA pseudouridine32 synthase/23S rRNA pseudouridine746 synthase